MANFIHPTEEYTASEESGAEDSDEDIITDYLSPLDDNGNLDAATNCRSLVSGDSGGGSSLSGGGNGGQKMATSSSGNGNGSVATNASVAASHSGVLSNIPSISITQHSPAASKAFYVLEDNLRQLHGIQESIQRMRQVSVQTLRLQIGRRRSRGLLSTLSASCPSLSNGQSNNNEADWFNSTLIDWDSPTPPSMTQYWGGDTPKKGSLGNSKRRRSWASPWEVDEIGQATGVAYDGRRADHGNRRHRSTSLSSVDTDENEDGSLARPDPVADAASKSDAVDGIFTTRGGKVIGGGHSTHSLNDMGIPLVPPVPMKARDSKEGELNKWLSPRILTLQKSISTPSILAVKDGSTVALPQLSSNSKKDGANTGPTSSYPRLPSYAVGLESETDDDSELHLDHHASSSFSLNNFSVPGFENFEDANSSKRRKRGSIFFRKRKDKEKDKNKLKNPHHFVSVCHSNSQPCDVCSKSLTNKAALRCESCAITVHEHSCRDQVNDCTRFKIPKSVPIGSKTSMAGAAGVKSSLSGAPMSASGSANSNQAGGLVQGTSVAATSSNLQWATNTVTYATSAASVISPTPSTPVASPSIISSKSSQDKEPDNTTTNEEVALAPIENDSTGVSSEVSEEVVSAAEVKDLDLDPELGILEEEAEAWVGAVDKKISKKMKEKEVKRQEHIYEFIITEKHHCLTLKVMQKIFSEGMRRELRFPADIVDRIFPCLEELLDYHLHFLRRLRQRQRQEPVVRTIEDILRLQFSGVLGEQLRGLYGEFCSRHQEAVSIYKELIKEDRKFAAFVRQCTMNPLCKKKGIPECILFVTQRITKYPLLIDPLIKTSREQPDECLKLQQVLGFVKDILVGVNAQVAEKERKLRLIEVYNKIDAKSATTYRNKKFKKSDLLSSNRRLMFEGVAYLNHARGKVQLVTVIVLSDVVFFLQESNQKFHFVTQDNKAGVISLQKLLVREKAGGSDTRSIYLISSNPDEPEMYELQCQNPREKKIWIDTIRAAVEQCPEDEEEPGSEGEEQRKIREAQAIKVKQLIGTLKDKDRQLASLLEEKMVVFCELVELLANNEDGTAAWNLLGSDSAPPKYSHLLEHGFHSVDAKSTLSQALSELHRLLGLLYSSNLGGSLNLSRSASSVGERQSDTFSIPLLPKRAETFGGFDSSAGPSGKEKGLKKKPLSESISESCAPDSAVMLHNAPVLQLNGEQQAMGLELTHHVSSLMCLLSAQATALESLRSDLLAEIRAACSSASLSHSSAGGPMAATKFQYKASHNQRLEELRNLQDRLSREKAEWQRERAIQEEQINEQKKHLLKLQEQVRSENADVQQQRENLYQKLEALRGQGILLSPNMTIVSTAPIATPSSPGEDAESATPTVSLSPPPPMTTNVMASPTPSMASGADLGRRRTIAGSTVAGSSTGPGLIKRDSSSNLPLPMNLISAKNEQKAAVAMATNLPIRQQLPMKLAKLASAGGGGTGTSSGSGLASGSSIVSSPSSSSNIVHQLLPLRLSENLEHKRGSPKSTMGLSINTGEGFRMPPADSFKPKLSSNSFSPPASKSEDFVAGHSRTGSSPASIQVLSPGQRLPPSQPPKVPEKPAALMFQSRSSPQHQSPLGPASASASNQQPAKVHDPETNQEIVFL